MKPFQLRYKLKHKKDGTYNRGDRTSQSQRYYSTRRKAQRAHHHVSVLLRKGILIRPTVCSICNMPNDFIHAHHTNYDEPEKVTWVCWKCHNSLHEDRR